MFSELSRMISDLTNETDNRKSLDIAIETANEIITLLNPRANGLKTGEDALDDNIPINKFPNYKVESWFAQHPYFTGERVALNFYESETVQIKFYWLGDSATKSRVSAGVMLTPNWEDSDLTRNDQYKIGIDFFLSANTRSLLMVASNKGNLRILEFSDRLSNTQQDILTSLKGVLALGTKDQIHKTLWDALALSEVNKKFYLGIAEKFNELLNHLVADGKDSEDSKLFASRLLGRLLFIWFLRRKNIIQEQYGYFDIDNPDSTEYYDQKLKKLFFNTLNMPASDRQHADSKTPYLNGGLFEAHDNDWVHQKVSFPTGFFNRLYEHLEQYNFTTDESSTEYEQVAIDPEMLGRVFESLLATQVTETGDQARKAKGAFYTPREIVSYMCKESLRHYLYTKLDNKNQKEGVDKLLDIHDSEWELQHSNAKRNLWGEKDRNTIPAKVLQSLDDMKVLDPACGSGAFPMGMLQLMLKTYERLDSRFDAYKTKLRIVQENIYGVDIEPMAVEISRLRAWLSLIVDEEDNSKIKPLPNLDFKFIVANSLLRLNKDFQLGDKKFDKIRLNMQGIIGKYFNANNKEEKNNLCVEFTNQRASLSQTNIFGEESLFQKQLNSFKPFDVHSEATFFDVKLMFGMKSKSPFDLVIGNPPYVQLQKSGGQLANMYQDQGYKTFTRNGDIYSLFYEKGLGLTKKDTGLLCYITSNKWMRAGYGEKTRNYFASKNPIILLDFGGFKVFESATVDTNILLIQNSSSKDILKAVHFKNDFKRDDDINDYFQSNNVSIKNLSADTWIIEDPTELAIKNKIQSVSKPLGDWDIYINKGLMTGYNNAFYIDRVTKDRLVAEDSRASELIRPSFRGRDISRYSSVHDDNSFVIVTSDRVTINNYPSIKKHLEGYKDNLVDRAQYKRGDHEWFTVDNCPSKKMLSLFDKEKIIYPNMTQEPIFTIDDSGAISNDKTFIIASKNPYDILFLAGVLNSRVGSFLIRKFCPGLGGRGVELRKIFMKNIPIPLITKLNKPIADELTEKVSVIKDDLDNRNISDQIDQLVYKLYGLTAEEIDLVEKNA